MNTRLITYGSKCFLLACTVVAALSMFAARAGALDPDPLQALKAQVHTALASAPAPAPTGFDRDDYFETIDGIVQYFRNYQQADGRIFDPYENREVQYATPYYAMCGSVLYVNNYRSDQPGAVISDPGFLESIALALDRATWELYASQAADGHSNFFTVPCMIAYWNLKDDVDPSRAATWESNLTGMSTNQYCTCTLNWMLTASTGDFLRYLEFEATGPYDINTSFMEARIAENMNQLTLEGLYRDGGYPYSPMAYDGFGRLNLQLLYLYGYGDTSFPGAADIPEYVSRGAWTSMLMQSPWGEMPLGGRSAQHQWNETEMCFIYEAWAAEAQADGDTVSAQAFKRAAHLSYASLRRWITPQGYVHIVKNHIDPADRFGYESYSYLSQYNMWTAGFLSLAATFADETISEGPAPADIGGFAFEVPDLHKVFANSGGLYVEIDTDPEDDYDITGLARVHKAGVEPLVGPSAPTTDLGVLRGLPELGTGIAWNTGSDWQSLADVDNSQISSSIVNVSSMSSSQVDFDVTYNFSGVPGATSVTEQYVVTPADVTVTASVTGSTTQTKLRYAAFLYDGRDAYTVGYDNGLVQTKLADNLMTMELTSHPSTPFVRDNFWVNSRNGYLEPIEGIVNATSLTYVLRPELDPGGSLFVASNQYTRTDFSYYANIPAYSIISSSAGAEESGNPRENSYDDSPTTRWASTGSVSTSWIEYDLGQPRQIDQLYLDLYNGSTRTYALRIEIDGTPVWTGSTTTSSAGWTQAIPETTGQVVGIYMTGNNSDGNGFFSIYEARIGLADASDLTPPAAPTGLSAAAGDNRVSLDWDDNSEGDWAGYHVYRASMAGGPYSRIASGVEDSHFVDYTALNGASYYYVVTAIDIFDNESAYSNEAAETPQPPIPELVAQYAFDGTGDDSSGHGYDGVATGGPSYVTGLANSAIHLDGLDDVVTLPAGVADSSDITFATWVRWGGGDNWQRIFDFGNNTSQYMFLSPSSGNGTLRFAISVSGYGGEQRVEAPQLAVDEWVHLAVTLQGNVGTLYVNGVPVDADPSVTLNPSDLLPVNNLIGDSQFSTDPLFAGDVEEFRIYNHALSAGAIAALAASASDTTPPSPPTGLTATIGDGVITLDWDDSAEADFMRYHVYRSLTSGSGYQLLDDGAATSDYVDTTVSDRRTYYYVVTAIDTSNNESGFGEEAVGTRPPHDIEPDGDIDLDDWSALTTCLTGPGGGNVNCEVFDADEDGDVDLMDALSFQHLFTGPA